MGRRRNRASSGQGTVTGSGGGKEVAVGFGRDDDDLTAGKDDNSMFENLRERSELVFEIFARMSPQNLFKFRCVSKGFCSFIGQAYFTAHHYRSCKAIAGKAPTGLFLQNNGDPDVSWYDYVRTRFVPVVSEAGGLPDPSLEFLKQNGKADEVDVIDSCNGLLLCSTLGSNGKTFFVCNPLTKEKITLSHPRKPSHRASYALMADLECNYLKYRVLCLLRSKYCGDGYSQLLILSSETGDWVEVCDKLPPASYDFRGGSKVFFNGSLYWDCLDGHILVCHFNSNGKEPCYMLIKTPRAILGRCLWKSKDKLHCYCHGVGDEFPGWTLCNDAGEELKWKNEDFDQLRNLTDDIGSFTGLTMTKKVSQSEFKIISYAPESETFFIYTLTDVYAYQWKARRLKYLGGFGFRSQQSQCWVLPYSHSLVPIQTAKAALGPAAERDIKMLNQAGRANIKSETGSETKRVRGRRNKRMPRCQDFSAED